MRSNYDKPWRCPAWSGPAMTLLDWEEQSCEGGSTARFWGSKWDHWKVFRCPKCGTVILPYVLRNLDPSWWKWRMKRRRMFRG